MMSERHGMEAGEPVWGCVLIGGASSRMGRPKHLIRQNGCTWLESTVAKLRTRLEKVVVSGRGILPPNLVDLQVIHDEPGLRGPLAGILSVMHWNPDVSWIATGCDQPDISGEAIDWLLGNRRREILAILPDLHDAGRVEPLLAYYDRRCRSYLEEIAAGGSFRIAEMIGRPGIITPIPPKHLLRSWRNVNTPEEMV